MSNLYQNYNSIIQRWGNNPRKELFEISCKHLGMCSTQVENIWAVGFHSVLRSSSIQLTGNILEEVKNDPAILKKEKEILGRIKSDPKYGSARFSDRKHFYAQLGGNRARGPMWRQALEFWKWPGEYSETWKMAFNELTWTVRSVQIDYQYIAYANGRISIFYSFKDILDLRPDWGGRSFEYNAATYILGFLYHDVIGGNDQLQITAHWKSEL